MLGSRTERHEGGKSGVKFGGAEDWRGRHPEREAERNRRRFFDNVNRIVHKSVHTEIPNVIYGIVLILPMKS